MISELTFIREYNSFWARLLPGADVYIRAINAVLSEEVFKHLSISENDTSRRALINNTAFSLFSGIISGKFKIDDLKYIDFGNSAMKDLLEKEKERLWNSRFGQTLTATIDDSEKPIIIKLCERLFEYYSSKSNVIINPFFSGIGMLNSAEGDVFYETTLSEVKAGGKNYKIQDLRQLYTYLALNSNSFKRLMITKIELFNPRTGVVWSENIDEVSSNLAGTSTTELLKEIVFFVSEEFRSI